MSTLPVSALAADWPALCCSTGLASSRSSAEPPRAGLCSGALLSSSSVVASSMSGGASAVSDATDSGLPLPLPSLSYGRDGNSMEIKSQLDGHQLPASLYTNLRRLRLLLLRDWLSKNRCILFLKLKSQTSQKI